MASPPQPDDADVLLFNTCSVREHAESKAYSRVGIVGKRKKAGERSDPGRVWGAWRNETASTCFAAIRRSISSADPVNSTSFRC